jgi:uncharacterized protein YecE (DUF72 family)
MTVYVGTCGFSYPEWVGPVYPEKTRSEKMLEVYSGMFPAVEIDSTYYRPPSGKMFVRYPERTGGELKVSVKLHSSFTHERTAEKSDAGGFIEAVKPLKSSGQFVCFLAQFPQSFHCTPENREYMEHLRLLFPDTTLVCEFRHEDWWNKDVLKSMAELGFAVATVDAPDMSTLPPNKVIYTSDPGYVRLHGRNYKGWYKGATERYTYCYTSEELGDWIKKIKKLASHAGDVFVFFNNHPLGNAAKNAKGFIDLIKLVMPRSLASGRKRGASEQGELFGAGSS